MSFGLGTIVGPAIGGALYDVKNLLSFLVTKLCKQNIKHAFILPTKFTFIELMLTHFSQPVR